MWKPSRRAGGGHRRDRRRWQAALGYTQPLHWSGQPRPLPAAVPARVPACHAGRLAAGPVRLRPLPGVRHRSRAQRLPVRRRVRRLRCRRHRRGLSRRQVRAAQVRNPVLRYLLRPLRHQALGLLWRASDRPYPGRHLHVVAVQRVRLLARVGVAAGGLQWRAARQHVLTGILWQQRGGDCCWAARRDRCECGSTHSDWRWNVLRRLRLTLRSLQRGARAVHDLHLDQVVGELRPERRTVDRRQFRQSPGRHHARQEDLPLWPDLQLLRVLYVHLCIQLDSMSDGGRPANPAVRAHFHRLHGLLPAGHARVCLPREQAGRGVDRVGRHGRVRGVPPDGFPLHERNGPFRGIPHV
mmetsp:Transcript_5300/g.12765  ORF Transcript_5300/g.12765 Transcript_5300/m.12765 type:complete len:354 (-) Transcript_5300:415-1476(-)